MTNPFAITSSDRLVAVKVACADLLDFAAPHVIGGLLEGRFSMKCIGSGAFSTVYSADDLPFVVKVNRRMDTYPVFVKYCVDVAGDAELSKNLPTILYYRPFEQGYICILPKYRADDYGSLPPVVELPYDLQCQYANIMDGLGQDFRIPYYNLAETAHRMGIGEHEAGRNYWRINSGEYADTRAAASVMSEELMPVCGSFDMHHGNILVDGDRLVIIDPIAGGDTSRSSEMKEYTAPEIEEKAQ